MSFPFDGSITSKELPLSLLSSLALFLSLNVKIAGL